MNNSSSEYLGCTAAAILTITQTQQVFQIAQLVLTCLATFVTLAFTLYKWYKAAKKDGKIDEDEIEDGINIIKDGIKEIQNITKNNDESEKKE